MQTLKRSGLFWLLMCIALLSGLLWNFEPRFFPKSTADFETTRLLLDKTRFGGLHPEYAARLKPTDYVVKPAYAAVATEERLLHMDHRDIRVADPIDLPAYQGLECTVHYDDQLCPVPGACPDPDRNDGRAVEAAKSKGPCAVWGRGRVPFFEQPRFHSKQKSSHRHGSPFDTEGEWVDPDWRPKDSSLAKRYRFFTPSEMRQCLGGKRVLIQGDSLMRQIFERLIQFSRFMPTSIEYSGQNSSVYSLHANGTDHWDFAHPVAAAWRNGKLADIQPSPVFQVYFDWRPLLNFTHAGNTFKMYGGLHFDHVLTGQNYWADARFNIAPIIQHLSDAWDTANWNGSVSYMAAPPKPASHENEWEYVGRNEIMRVWSRTQAARLARPFHIIPADRMAVEADRAGWPERGCGHFLGPIDACLEDWHWASSFNVHYPRRIQIGLGGLTAPRGFDCRDPFNLAVLQNWLNTICF